MSKLDPFCPVCHSARLRRRAADPRRALPVRRARLPDSYVNVFSPAELVLLALAGLVIGVAGALLPASWAARTRTASVLRAG
jgi:hypothetical protein